jgi:elongation factor P
MSVTDIFRVGMCIVYDGNACLVVAAQFVNPGKGAAFTRTKIKNLKTGQVKEVTIKSGDTADLADVQHRKCQFLYSDGTMYNFMDNENFEQFALEGEVLGEKKRFLVDGTQCHALYIDNIPVSIELPPKMDFKVTSAPPRSKGNTATGDSKEVTIETGATVKVPAFIEEGMMVKINTEDGSYVSKA